MRTEDERIEVGDRVYYHPIIGGPHDGREYVVRSVRYVLGQEVAFLEGKAGFVSLSSLELVAP